MAKSVRLVEWMIGLIGPGDRKSIQPMARRLALGECDQLHHFIAAGVWDGGVVNHQNGIAATDEPIRMDKQLGFHRRRSIGGFPMAIILHELLVFSCLAAFVTGIVIAAASLL
jgi:hypothetical protein